LGLQLFVKEEDIIYLILEKNLLIIPNIIATLLQYLKNIEIFAPIWQLRGNKVPIIVQLYFFNNSFYQ
jgi:hypothetical protein